MNALIEDFAARFNLRLRRDSCGDMIAGKPPKPRAEDRSHIFDAGGVKLGLCLMLARPKQWTFAKRRLLSASFELKQEGAVEGTFLFDPDDDLKCRHALKEGGIRCRRALAPEEKARRATRLAFARNRGLSLPGVPGDAAA